MVNRPPENNESSSKAEKLSPGELASAAPSSAVTSSAVTSSAVTSSAVQSSVVQSSSQSPPDSQVGGGQASVEFDEFSMSQPPSAVALKLRKLKSASFRAAQARERLPHPLFWSLFLTEVSELKKKKEEKRLLDRILLGVGTE